MSYSSRDRASSEAVTQPQGVLNSGKGGMGLEVYSTGGNQQNYDYCLLKVVGSAGFWVPGSGGTLGSGFRLGGDLGFLVPGGRATESRQGTSAVAARSAQRARRQRLAVRLHNVAPPPLHSSQPWERTGRLLASGLAAWPERVRRQGRTEQGTTLSLAGLRRQLGDANQPQRSAQCHTGGVWAVTPIEQQNPI